MVLKRIRYWPVIFPNNYLQFSKPGCWFGLAKSLQEYEVISFYAPDDSKAIRKRKSCKFGFKHPAPAAKTTFF